ncbi:hypothetical protein [Brevibacillus reuszeri]|uniref:hypothetical protein n=1 Tax=Brevibacillus reuszeri TaxID=54915 RepID=UPI0028A15AC5|nr:hypothetical protein [Brevibacillus reuszeri]
MDLEQKLRKSAKHEQDAVPYDPRQMHRMSVTIHKRLQSNRKPFPFVVAPIVVVVLIVVFLSGSLEHFRAGVGTGKNIEGENNRVIEYTPAPVISDRLTKMLNMMTSYDDIEIKKTGPSQLTEVFLRADEAYEVETNKGKLQVVIFPENFDAERIELDEDLTRSGNITYTFTGTELKEELLPLRAKGPTYVYVKNNLLFAMNNSSLVGTIGYVFYISEVHTDILTSFGMNPDEYDIYKRVGRTGKESWSEKQLKDIAIIALRPPEELEKGDLMPAIFFKKGEPIANIIYQKANGVNKLRQYRWDQAIEAWILEQKKSVQGKKRKRE